MLATTDCPAQGSWLAPIYPGDKAGNGKDTDQNTNQIDKQHTKLAKKAAAMQVKNNSFQRDAWP